MKLRIIVDWKCNRKCVYCCNEYKEIIDSFKKVKFTELINLLFENQYEEIAVTGGEPLLFPYKVLSVINTIKQVSPFSKIFLYTNGDYINEDTFSEFINIFSQINGINIGLHNIPDNYKLDDFIDLYRSFPELSVRFLVQDIHKETLERVHGRRLVYFSISYWKMDDCLEMEKEHRVCLNI